MPPLHHELTALFNGIHHLIEDLIDCSGIVNFKRLLETDRQQGSFLLEGKALPFECSPKTILNKRNHHGAVFTDEMWSPHTTGCKRTGSTLRERDHPTP